MDTTRIDFASLPWEQSAEGARFKAFVRGGKKLRLVEFTSRFDEKDWCLKGHVGFVLEGQLEVAFDDTVQRFAEGDGIFIRGGEAERHKARAVGDVCRLLLVEEP